MSEHEIDTAVHEESGQGVPEREMKRVFVDLWHHSEVLIRQELALIKAEYEARLRAGKALLVRGAIASALFYAAYLTTLASLVLVLAQWAAPWLAALIVGGAAALGALAYLYLTKRALDVAMRPLLASDPNATSAFGMVMHTEPNRRHRAQPSQI